ncbi:flagellar hook capping FlgD N-terminal domain-containing protein [Clostridium sp.]|uniref:flagellar hook capping FlgD N-terminal domain-containing protein n=1 Tax=Clostridium sp. TaxID=1506 RepID=UPI001A43E0BD|nr:flagellar hook capping FlgD N-terminal domain-containing protein [Clostridium sp.]MBK5240407.1 flagellar biosynthesis protein FlgD [Clostridium sp.]
MATDISTALASSARATDRGTEIVKEGQAMDQNSFLKILSAELSNQDPTEATDGTEFVAQMAQFASLEQMSNMNNTMAFQTSSALVGKMVAFSSYDASGMQYGGTVKAVYKESGTTYMAVQLSDGIIKDFPADTLSDVIDVPDTTLGNLNGNAGFSAAISLMGKQVETAATDDEKAYSGTVKSVSRDSKGINLTITNVENGEECIISYDDISKVK